MAVAVGIGAALDVDAVRKGIGTRVALVVVLEVDGRKGGGRVDDGDRDADRAAVPEPRAEVGVEAEARADRANDPAGVLPHGQVIHPLVPDVRAGEDGAAGRSRKRLGSRRSHQGEDAHRETASAGELHA